MRVKSAFCLFALIFFLSVSASPQAGGGFPVDAQPALLSALPGENGSATISVKNTGPEEVMLYVASSSGGIREHIFLENTQTRLGGFEEKTLPIRFRVFYDAAPGEYSGGITLLTGNVNKTIPATLLIKDPWENMTLELRTGAFSENIAPGEALRVQVDIENPVKREINLTLVTEVVDPDSGEILYSAQENISVTTEKGLVVTIPIPKDFKKKEYEVKTGISSPREGAIPPQHVTDSFRVYIGITAMTSLTRYAKDFFASSNIRVFLGILPAMAFAVAAYWRHKIVSERRKRYRSMVSFDYLPKGGRRSGYIGRVAETKRDAFVELDVLQTHTLVAGATGSGKTVAAQTIIEEALVKGVSVIVFDPTAQWTGFLKPCSSRGMLRLYPHFKMKRSDAKGFLGNIRTIEKADTHIDVREYMNPGEITIFALYKLTPEEIDRFVENTVKDVFSSQLTESPECKTILVYDEVHRLLPKFGGSGRALVQLERAVREFRKWGVGLMLISQVLSDFVGEIKANIGTEVQMRTRYEKDLERLRLKYNLKTMRSIIKASVGTGMVQNAEYNQGRPYFISFRPLMHDPHRLSDETLDLYGKYNEIVDGLKEKVKKLAMLDVDTFDLNLELNLALDNIRKGSFDVVELYTSSISERAGQLEEKAVQKRLEESEKNLESAWDKSAGREVSDFRKNIEVQEELRRAELMKQEKELKSRMGSEMEKLEERSNEIKERLSQKISAEEKQELISEQKETLMQRKELEEELVSGMEGLVGEMMKTEGRLWRIAGDRRLIEEKGEALSEKEKEIRSKVTRDITSIVDDVIKKKQAIVTEEERLGLVSKAMNMLQKNLMKKAWEEKQTEKEKREAELDIELERRKQRVYKMGRKNRVALVRYKDVVLTDLRDAKTKWSKILENEKLIREREEELHKRRGVLRKLIEAERKRILTEQKRIMEERRLIKESISKKALLPGVSVPTKEELLREIEFREKKIDQDFEHVEGEWDKMNKWLDEARKMDEELKTLRDQWEMDEEERTQEEKDIIDKQKELASLKHDMESMLKSGEKDKQEGKE